MKRGFRHTAASLLLLVGLAALFAPVLAPYDYSRQFREAPNAPASRHFPMGTDDLGRDRFSRLLYATRVSILLAPAAALVSILAALLISAVAAARKRWVDHALSGLTTLCLSLPWIFLFIILRARPAAEYRPLASILLTFGLMGVSGMGVAGANLRRFHPPDHAIRLDAAGARVRNSSLEDCADTRLATPARRRHRPVPRPDSRIHPF